MPWLWCTSVVWTPTARTAAATVPVTRPTAVTVAVATTVAVAGTATTEVIAAAAAAVIVAVAVAVAVAVPSGVGTWTEVGRGTAVPSLANTSSAVHTRRRQTCCTRHCVCAKPPTGNTTQTAIDGAVAVAVTVARDPPLLQRCYFPPAPEAEAAATPTALGTPCVQMFVRALRVACGCLHPTATKNTRVQAHANASVTIHINGPPCSRANVVVVVRMAARCCHRRQAMTTPWIHQRRADLGSWRQQPQLSMPVPMPVPVPVPVLKRRQTVATAAGMD